MNKQLNWSCKWW